MVKSVNVKKTKKFKENRPENYHVHDSWSQRTLRHCSQESWSVAMILLTEASCIRAGRL